MVHWAICRGTETVWPTGAKLEAAETALLESVDDDAEDDCGWEPWLPICSPPQLLLAFEFDGSRADSVLVGDGGQHCLPPTPSTSTPALPMPELEMLLPPPPEHELGDSAIRGSGSRERGPMQQQSATLDVRSIATFSFDVLILSDVNRSLEFVGRIFFVGSIILSIEFDGCMLS